MRNTIITASRRRIAASVFLIGFVSAAWASPGRGIKLKAWTLVPYLDGGLTYDSNIHQAQDHEEDDLFSDIESGLRFSRMLSPTAPTFDGSLFFMRRMGASDNGGFDSFGDALRLRRSDGGAWRYEVTHSFRRVDDADQHASDLQSGGVASDIGGASSDLVQDIHTLSQQRDVHQFGLATEVGVTDKSDLGLTYLYSTIRYEDGVFQDLDGHILQGESGYRVTEETSVFLSLRQGLQNQEGMPESTTYSVVRGGLKSRGSDKVSYKAGAGALFYSRPGLDGADDETTTEFNYDASADWLATDKITIRGGANTGIQLSSIYAGNALEYKSVWSGVSWRPVNPWILSVRGSYRMDDYLDAVADGNHPVHRKDKRADLGCRVDYLAHSGCLRVYAEIFPWWVDSNLSDLSYDEMRISVGCSVQY